ncbi:hypothetical protein MtrunA17_Chr3g0092691 [Medicago truncatula]|uniref:Uncharacterized protein n=1 Tax=Medicago truncatula TaxID=3880 RepID=A0A396IMQ7_MEDTR|nr:hypothetical protein MtrunA17_Chr3g0092691 [Medicago truncatula]
MRGRAGDSRVVLSRTVPPLTKGNRRWSMLGGLRRRMLQRLCASIVVRKATRATPVLRKSRSVSGVVRKVML